MSVRFPDHDQHYTPKVREKMRQSARAAWKRRKANGYVSQRDIRRAAPDLYKALKRYVDHYGDPLKCARAAIAKAEGRS